MIKRSLSTLPVGLYYVSLSKNKKETIKAGFMAFTANILGRFISIPVGIVVASILGPGDYGILAIVNLIIQYLSYLNLGFLANISREVPIAYGQGNTEEVKTVYSTVFTNYTITTILGIVVLWVLYLLGFDYNGDLIFKHIILITAIKLASYADSYFHTYIKGEGKFIIFGQYELVNKIAIPLLNLVMVYFFQLTGMLIALALSHIVGTLFAWMRLGKPYIRFKINFNKTTELMRTGTLMYLNKIIDGVFISVGLIMAGKYLGKVDVGLLSFAMVIASTSKVPFADIFTMTIRRQMGVEGGKYGINNYKHFARFFGTNLIVYALLMTSVLGMLVLFYSMAVNIFLQKFLLSVPIFIILYFSMNLYSIRTFLYAYLNITRQMNKQSVILAVGVLINIFLCYSGIKLGYGVLGIALGVAVSFLVVSINTMYVTFSQIYENQLKKYFFILKILLISTVLTSILYIYSDFTFFTYGSDYHVIKDMVFAVFDLSIKIITFLVISCGSYIVLFPSEKVFAELVMIINHIFERFRYRFQLGAA